MNVCAAICLLVIAAGVVFALAILMRGLYRKSRGGTDMFLYPVSRSAWGITEAKARVRTPPGKR